MKRAERLIKIIELMQSHRRPVTANYMAEQLDVTPRTIYRDMDVLQQSGVPIDGEAGIGYIMGGGYHMPAMMYTEDEVEALMLGLRMVKDRGDKGLQMAAQNLIGKISTSIPDDLATIFLDNDIYAPHFGKYEADKVDTTQIRKAMRTQQKLLIDYIDVKGDATTRIIWPILLAHFNEARNLVAYCEVRQAFRAFRTDRIERLLVLDEKYQTYRKKLVRQWAIENKIPDLAR